MPIMNPKKANPREAGAMRLRDSLKQLLKECSPRASRSRKKTTWVSDKLVGRELI
jgi:hypothetical protein